MRICVIFRPLCTFLIAITTQLPVFAQVNDKFSDGDFTNNPTWNGSTSRFQINAAKQLQLNGIAASDTAYLSTPNSLIDNTQWDFYVRMAFSASGSNYLRLYLVSDQPDLKSNLNGYYIRIGESGSLDGIDLYRQSGKSSFKILDGINGHAAKSNNTLRIRVTRDNSGNWTLFSDTLGGNNLALEGVTFDNGFVNTGFMGVSCRYSSSNKTKFYFDDISVMPIPVDTFPPLADSARAISKSQCNVYFNEPLDIITAENTTNYTINNGIGKPLTASLDGVNPQIVHLTINGTFTDNLLNKLTISGIKDLAGNTVSPVNINFTYHAPIIAKAGDVLINEIYPDPTPTVGLPASEYIELYNKTSKPFSLKGWKFTDGSSTATLPILILNPNSYLILCAIADTSAFSSYGKVAGLSSFPSLNNTGDHLSLLNDSLQVIDEVNYSDKWYKDAEKDFGGWSLERISPNDSSCRPIANWTASTDSSGGTPGKKNSVLRIDVNPLPPQISALTPLSSNRLKVCLSKPADSLSLTSTTSYALYGYGTPVSAVVSNVDWNEVILTYSSPFQQGKRYTLTLNGITDCAGKSIVSSYDFYMGISGKAGDVVITEIYPDPSPSNGLPEQEFVEIYNRSNLPIQMGGWKLNDGSTSVKLDSTVLLPHEYLILCSFANAKAYSPYGKVLPLDFLPSLNNNGDMLSLYNTAGDLMESLTYTSNSYQDVSKKDGGWTIEKTDPDFICNNPLNWQASVSTTGGTPGKQNSVNSKFVDTTAPLLTHAFAPNDSTISLYFSEIVDTNSLKTKENYNIYPSLSVKNIAVNGAIAKISLKEHLIKGQTYSVIVFEGLTDCPGNKLAKNSAKVGLSEPAGPGDLSINELLFNPYSGTPDFVEFVNTSDKIISAISIKIANRNTGNDLSTIISLKDSSRLIFPGDYLAITTDETKLGSVYPHTAAANVLEVSSLPSFNDDKGSVVLLAAGNTIIDEFAYSSDMHFPLLKDKEGVSLEKTNPALNSGNYTYWHSAAESAGFATPGFKNSQYSELSASDGTLTVDPYVFSPDNDGYHDILNVLYHLDKPGKLANVTIYNTSGLLVRKLIKHELLASDGTFSWDGLDETRSKAASGIYIILTEIFDSTGNTEVKKNTCVLGTKL